MGLVDHEIGRLLAGLAARELTDETIVVLTADHGEAFGEHGTGGHGLSGFEEEIAVPLVLYVPGLDHAVVEDNVGIIDVVPTLLDLLAVETDHVFSGRSLLALVFSMRGLEEREVVSQAWRYSLSGERELSIKALVFGDHKLIYDELDGYFAMFDLAHDPHELHNVADDDPESFTRLRTLLMNHVELDHHRHIETSTATR